MTRQWEIDVAHSVLNNDVAKGDKHPGNGVNGAPVTHSPEMKAKLG